MRLWLLLTSSFVMYCLQCHGQAYEPGLLVCANGDTLRGEIENGHWEQPPTFIRFRAAPDSASRLFKPRQLRRVSFAKGRQFSFEALPIDHSAETRPDRLVLGLHPDVRTDSLLAEVLVEGPASLLRVVRISATHYLVRRPGQPVLDLAERLYLHTGRYGALERVNGNNYRAQLGLFFGDCPAASRAAAPAAFTPPELAAVVQAFNESCASGGAPGRNWLAQATARRGTAVYVGAMVGARHFLVESDLVSRLAWPTGGLYGELLLPNRTIGLYADFNLGLLSGKGTTQTGNTPTNPSQPTYSDYTYRTWRGMARLGAHGYFPLPHEQQFFVSFGFALDLYMGHSLTTVSGPPVPSTVLNTSNEVLLPLPYVGVGWRQRRVSVSAEALFYDQVYDLRLGVGYRLTRNPDAVKAKSVQ
jgi:hypothetical protein